MASTGGFPGTTGAGSIFFATQADALSTALNSGWLEDQSINYGTGVFATRAFVNGTTSFISTGDGTAFYVPGRVLRIAQGASTTFSVVAESSFSVGQTIIRVPYNTTGGAVALSTVTAFTGVLAGPTIPGSSGNMPMVLNVAPSTATANYIQIGTAAAGGSPTIQTTGADGAIDLTLTSKGGQIAMTSFLKIGTNPAAAGYIRLSNLGSLFMRNAGNTADLQFMGQNASTAITIGDAGDAGAVFNSPNVRIGITPGSSGLLRLANSAIAIVGKDANAVDDTIWPQQTLTATLAADTTMASTTYVDGASLTLGAGKWSLAGALTCQGHTAPRRFVGRISDGTTILRTGQMWIANSCEMQTLHISAIASTSSIWKISAVTDTTATGLLDLIAVVSTAVGQTTAIGATYLNAVKIG